jgi:hypothetical protein
MAEATPLATTIDAFDRARGDDMDGVWAHSVAWRLLRRDVEPGQVDEGLTEALALVRETQEAPADLFGSSEEHADALYDHWVDDGRLHLWDASSMAWREVPSWGLGMGAFWCIGFMVAFLADGETSRTWTLGMVVIPVGIGWAKAAALAAWDSVLRSRGPVVAVLAVAATMATAATAIASVNEWGKAHPLGTASTWWYLWAAASCALLAMAWGRWLESRPAPAPPGIADVDDWSRQLAAILRGSHHLSEVRVRTIVGDAHAHASDAGRTVQEEFGTPAEHAARFTPDRARKRRLEAWFWVFLGVMQGLWLLEDFTWLRAAVVLACLLVAWRTSRRTD